MEKSAVAVILAGGKGQRFGGVEKALIRIGGHKLIDRIIAVLRPQCAGLALSLRIPQPWTADYEMPVLFDRPITDVGPLGGIAAALFWAQSLDPLPNWVITVPVDLPFLPRSLIERLTTASADVVVARSNNQTHHAVAAWRLSLLDSMLENLKSGPMAIRKFQSLHSVTPIEWSTSPVDPFLNINTLADAEAAEHYARSQE